jgi:hypothetical protein
MHETHLDRQLLFTPVAAVATIAVHRILLLQVSDFPLGVIFALCSIFLAAAAGCQHRLGSITSSIPVTRLRKEHVSDDFGHTGKLQQQQLQQTGEQQEQQQHLLQMPEMAQQEQQQQQQQQQAQRPAVQFVSINRSGVLSRRQEQQDAYERKGSSNQLASQQY